METMHCLFLMLCLGVISSSSETLRRQKRDWIIDSFSIDESYSGPFPYDLGHIKIEKNLTIFKIHGQGVDMEPKGLLQIHPESGIVTVHGPIDYEKYQDLMLTFQAFDSFSHRIDTQLGIELTVIDANDNPPKCNPANYNVTIQESTPQGTKLITLVVTDEDTSAVNGPVEFKLVSVTPQPQHDLQFTLSSATDNADISFKGCLDHEREDQYRIIVEVRDQQTPELSSSCFFTVNIEDGNNHRPVITGQQGSGRVKEREENVLVKRLQVQDGDGKGTSAWRAKFTLIQGDTDDNFMITTDPETNDGLLYVKKPLDYEDSPVKNLTISVENETPYHLCQVTSRLADPWDVVILGEERPLSTQVVVTVEDVNEAPIFFSANKQVTISEEAKVGLYLETFEARDPDSGNNVTYRTGDDPNEWVSVDAETGRVTTSKTVDRESSFVNDSIYTTTILAVDNGQPPMTGTGTLEIHITDVNDNAPALVSSAVDMCQDDRASLTKVMAFDPDDDPYGGPFTFNLLGDVKDKWRLESTQGYSVNLVKEATVHSGHHDLLLELFDLQGHKAVQKLSVTVCRCQDAARPNCHVKQRQAASATPGAGWLAVFLLSILLLAAVLLCALMASCEKKRIEIPDEGSVCLMTSNIEQPGTDCKVPFKPFISYEEQDASINQTEQNFSHRNSMQMTMGGSSTTRNPFIHQVNNSNMDQTFSHGNSVYRSIRASSMRTTERLRSSVHETWAGHSRYSPDAVPSRADILHVLNMRLSRLETAAQELGDYAPRVYADEGDTKPSIELDAISVSDVTFDPDMELDVRFSTLASLCAPAKQRPGRFSSK